MHTRLTRESYSASIQVFFEIDKIETSFMKRKFWSKKKKEYERKEVLVPFQLL